MTRSLTTCLILCLIAACSSDSDSGVTQGDISGSDSVTGDTVSGDTAAQDVAVQDVSVTDTSAPDSSQDDTVVTVPDATTTDVSEDIDETLPPAGIQAQFQNCSEPGGDRNIYDLQDPQCPDHVSWSIGQSAVSVVLKDVIVSAVFGDTLFVQEDHGGAYSGISVYTHGMPTQDLVPGDVLTVTGGYSEFYEVSQIYLEDYEMTGSGEAPGPWTAPHPAHLAQGDVAEMLEGVLVRVLDVETTHTQPDCPHDYGEFEVTGGLRIDDIGPHWDARLGDVFSSITGPLHYGFGNYKIEPRDENDIKATALGHEDAISKCFAAECQAADDDLGTQSIVITEFLIDPFGSDTGQEWIELYNPGDSDVSLDGWELRDCGEQAYPLVGANLIVTAGGFLVIGASDNSATNGNAPVDYSYGAGFYLPNTVGSVLLYDGAAWQGVLVDQTRYSRFDPWDVLVSGKSMERKNALAYGADPDNWNTGSGSYGSSENEGSPGQENKGW
jgi:hypothetical protein